MCMPSAPSYSPPPPAVTPAPVAPPPPPAPTISSTQPAKPNTTAAAKVTRKNPLVIDKDSTSTGLNIPV